MARVHLMELNGWWYYNRRVPNDFAHLDKRGTIRRTTKIRVEDDRQGTRAARIAINLDNDQRQFWRDLIRGRTTAEAYRDLKEAMKASTRLGLVYLSREEVANLPNDDELINRIRILTATVAPGDRININDARGALGGPAKPAVVLMLKGSDDSDPKACELLKAYKRLPEIRKELAPKNEEQVKRWEQVRRLAIEKLVESIGDKDIATLTSADGRQFVDDCFDRIEEKKEAGETKTGEETARQQFDFLTKMIREVAVDLGLKQPNGNPIELYSKKNPFDQAQGKRMPFTIDFVRDNMLAKPANLDPKIHDLVLTCIDTGMRPSELINMPEDDIHVLANIPYLDIRSGNGRTIKNKFSQRKIPLVGVALDAMRRNPQGFPEFRENHEYVRKLINEWLRSLQPDVLDEEKKTLYCLRHTFKDRLLRTTAVQETMDYLMGHNPKKENYGDKGVDFTLPVMNQLAF
jgi:integrase